MTHTLEADWIDDRIVVVSFSDASRLNQMSWAAVDELGALLQAMFSQPEVNMGLTTGLGGQFGTDGRKPLH